MCARALLLQVWILRLRSRVLPTNDPDSNANAYFYPNTNSKCLWHHWWSLRPRTLLLKVGMVWVGPIVLRCMNTSGSFYDEAESKGDSETGCYVINICNLAKKLVLRK